MNLLKRPFFAIIVSALFVISSTLLSVHIGLSAECRKITDGFVDGIQYEGEIQKGIAFYLNEINLQIDGIADIAAGCGIDTDDLLSKSNDMQLGLTYSSESASYLFFCYEELKTELKLINKQLADQNLSEENLAQLQNHNSNIEKAQQAISQSAYNETVRQFIRKNDVFPTNVLADLAGVYMPEYFA